MLKEDTNKKGSYTLDFTQIAWVVKDIELAKTFFQELLGVHNFSEIAISRLNEYDGTYYGEPSNAENLVAMAYSSGTFIELIQPVIGNSIFQDYIENHPAGGVQHIAYSTPIANFDTVISHFEQNGFPVVSSFNTPIAKIVFFDTRTEIGVFTEIMGVTDKGKIAIQKMRTGTDRR